MSGAGEMREKGRRAGCRCAPPAPGFGASEDPRLIQALSHRIKIAVAFWFVQCTLCGMLLFAPALGDSLGAALR